MHHDCLSAQPWAREALVFIIRRPTPAEIEQFLDRCEKLPLSYGPAGIIRRPAGAGRLDEEVVTIGRGRANSERASLDAQERRRPSRIRARFSPPQAGRLD